MFKKNGDQPVYQQVADYFEKKILTNQLKANEKMPSIRTLAEQLKVNKDTIVQAYKELEQRGYVTKKKGKGTFVYQPMSLDDELQVETKEIAYPFGATGMSDTDFPVESFSAAFRKVLQRDKGQAFGYHDPTGYEPLRYAIQKSLKEQGIVTALDNIIIITGAHQGMDIVAKTIDIFGERIFVEDPSYQHAISFFRSVGGKVRGIPLQADGIDLKALERETYFGLPRLLYLMPNFHNPTGISYSEKVKAKLLTYAKKHGAYIIEDDYTNDLYYHEPPRALISYDEAKDHVIYIKSLSKILMPGLRISYMVVPDNLLSKMKTTKGLLDTSTSGILQRALATFIEEDSFHQHLQQMREQMKEKMIHTYKMMNTYLPATMTPEPIEGGYNIWVKLPRGISEVDIEQAARQEGISIIKGMDFYLDGRQRGYMRLSIGQLEKEAIGEGIKLFAKALARVVYDGKIIAK